MLCVTHGNITCNSETLLWILDVSHTVLLFHLYCSASHCPISILPASVLSSNTVLVLLSSVSGVRLSPASPELILDHDHSSPSAGRLPSDAIISSPDDTRADSGLVSQTIPKAQVITSGFQKEACVSKRVRCILT